MADVVHIRAAKRSHSDRRRRSAGLRMNKESGAALTTLCGAEPVSGDLCPSNAAKWLALRNSRASGVPVWIADICPLCAARFT